MAWMKIETSVARHRKFIAAGPAASWLWLCGLSYCQEGSTDGFIPFDALDYLGVKSPKNLKCKLVVAGLWDEVPGGWKIHDYLEHNRSAAHINGIREERRKNGSEGGKASGHARRSTDHKAHTEAPVEAHREANVEANQNRLLQHPSKHPSNPTTATDHTATDHTATDPPPLDRWFVEFVAAYPESRRRSDALTQQAFVDAFDGEDNPGLHYLRLREALRNHAESEQWKDRNVIPSMAKWLSEKRWVQILAPAKAPKRSGGSGTLMNAEETRKYLHSL
jgi:hypothetical protein